MMRPFLQKIFLSSCLVLIANCLFAQQQQQQQQQQQSAKLVLPIGHTSFVNQLVFSYDGSKIATTSADHTAKIWNVNTGRLLIDFNQFGFETEVKSVAFNHSGSTIAISFGNDILLADPNTGYIKDTLYSKNSNKITYLTFSQNDSIIYAFCNGASVQEVDSWNVFSNKIINKRPCIFENQPIEVSDFLAVPTRTSIEIYDSIGNNEWSIGKLVDPSKVQFSYKDSLISFLDNGNELNFYHLSNSDSTIESAYKIKYLPSSLTSSITDYSFSPDRKTIVLISTTGLSQKAIIVDTKSLEKLKEIEFSFEHTFRNLIISADSKYYAFSRNRLENESQKSDTTLVIWNRETNNTFQLKCPEDNQFEDIIFSPNSKELISYYNARKPLLWNLETASLINRFEMFGKGIPLLKTFYSNDGSCIIQIKAAGNVEIWDAIAIKKIADVNNTYIFNNNDGTQSYPLFNKDASLMYEIFNDTVKKKWGIGIWNTKSFNRTQDFKVISDPQRDTIPITSLQIYFAETYTNLLITNAKGEICLWRIDDKLSIKPFITREPFNFAKFSPDGKLIIAASIGKIGAWNISDGSLQYQVDLPSKSLYSLNMSANSHASKLAVMKLGDSVCFFYDLYKGKLIKTIKTTERIYSVSISDDESKAVTYSSPKDYLKKARLFTEVWDLNKLDLFDTNSMDAYQSIGLIDYYLTKSIDLDNSHFTGKAIIKNPVFSPDSKNLLTISSNQPSDLILWNLVKHDSVRLRGHEGRILSADYSKDGKYIITSSLDNTSRIWKNDGTPLFTFIGLPGNEYLVLDSLMRFDGSNEAKKNLYVSCGNEIIDLEQFEDLCWEPDLVEKTLGIINRPIKAKSLKSVQLCSMIPLVINDKITKDAYLFSIYERQGKIGNIELYVKNKRVKQYSKLELTKVKDFQYQLKVDKKLVTPYFLKNGKNTVYLRVYTSDNKMISRGKGDEDEFEDIAAHKGENNLKPDVYLVSVGVKNYNGGVELNKLEAPAIDASAFSKAVIASSSNLFNHNDSINHVFSYLLTSDSTIPNKKNILNALDSIASKAKADDIFIFFFAGHAIYNNSPKDPDKNQLYLLTSESTSFDLSKELEQSRALSADELLSKLEIMKMSKQMLILDACNTGSLNTDVKVLNKLNGKGGTFILAGSAPNESSYEMPDLKHGILTYSLLQDIKEGSSLHSDDNGINNIIGAYDWLDESRKLVIKKTKKFNGQLQEPQVFGKNSFDVGMVNNKVRDAINLEKSKKLIGQIAVNYNDELQLKGAQGIKDSLPFFLNNYITKNKLSDEIVYNSSISSDNKNAYVVVISDYQSVNKKITVKVKISKGNQFIKAQTITMDVTKKNQLMNSIAQYIIDTILKSNS